MRAQHLLGRTHKHHLTSLSSGMRTQVDDMVGRHHHILIVLHHDHRVTDVAQRPQRVDKPFVVPLVQSYAWFVKDV